MKVLGGTGGSMNRLVMEFVRRDELPPRDNTLIIKIHSE